MFGDQLTVASIRSASVIRCTTDTGALEKFEGFIPAIADWHARANFLDVSYVLSVCMLNPTCLQVIWERFYSAKSVAEKGTLYQLKVLINRTAVRSLPSKNLKPTEDFLLLILHSYVIAAAEQCQQDSDTCELLAKRIVEQFVKINTAYMGKFWSGKKLANRGPFANILLANYFFYSIPVSYRIMRSAHLLTH